jgi:hypothetical protein
MGCAQSNGTSIGRGSSNTQTLSGISRLPPAIDKAMLECEAAFSSDGLGDVGGDAPRLVAHATRPPGRSECVSVI